MIYVSRALETRPSRANSAMDSTSRHNPAANMAGIGSGQQRGQRAIRRWTVVRCHFDPRGRTRSASRSSAIRRGLTPRPDTENSFHVKDPDGFDLQISGKEMKP